MNLHVVLYQPQIPQNTGNIARTCSVTGAKLTLIKPCGFSTSDKMVRRAGLDYWDDVTINEEDSLQSVLDNAEAPFFLFSSKAQRYYSEVHYPDNALLIFGAETHGLPEEILASYQDRAVTLPMAHNKRSLNLSNAVAIGVYEALRQNSFSF